MSKNTQLKSIHQRHSRQWKSLEKKIKLRRTRVQGTKGETDLPMESLKLVLGAKQVCPWPDAQERVLTCAQCNRRTRGGPSPAQGWDLELSNKQNIVKGFLKPGPQYSLVNSSPARKSLFMSAFPLSTPYSFRLPTASCSPRQKMIPSIFSYSH